MATRIGDRPETRPAGQSPAAAGLPRVLQVSAAVVLVSVTAWLVLLIPAMPTGEVSDQLATLGDGMASYRWGFLNAALINPAFVVMLYATARLLTRSPRPHEVAGGVFLAAYWLLPTLAYVSQFALLPRLVGTQAAEVWYFGNSASVSYWLAMTGYGLFGIGALLVASLFVRGDARAFGWLLAVSGAASLLGLVGYSIAIEALEFASTFGGALVIPLAVLAVLIAHRSREES